MKILENERGLWKTEEKFISNLSKVGEDWRGFKGETRYGYTGFTKREFVKRESKKMKENRKSGVQFG